MSTIFKNMRGNTEKIRICMARNHLSRADIIRNDGGSGSTITRIMHGEPVRPSTFGYFAFALGVDISDIISEDD